MRTNKLIHGNALKVLKKIPDESIDLIVTDPPYFLLNKKWDKQWEDEKEYLNWCKKWFKQCHRVLKEDGNFYVFQDWRLVSEYVIILKKVFPYFINWITWERIKGRSSKKKFKSVKEEILVFSKSKNPKFKEQKKIRPVIAPYRDKDGKPKGWFIDEEGNRVRWTGVGNVWHYTPPVWSSKKEKPIHPTQKPLMMIERIIKSSSEKNDIVLDPFAGSGTTAIACMELKRKYICIEKDKKIFKSARKRIDDANE